MAFIGRKMIKSERARMHRINVFFARVAKTFIILSAIFLTVIWLSERYTLKINMIEVKGTHAISATDIQHIASVPLSRKIFIGIAQDNMLAYPKQSVIREIQETYPRIVRAEISFPSRHRLVVHIEEYTPAFLYCLNHDIPPPLPRAPSVVTLSSDVSTSTNEMQTPAVQTEESHFLVPVLSDCFFADKDAYVFATAPEYTGYPFLAIIAPTSATSTRSTTSPIGRQVLPPVDHARINSFIFALDRLLLRTHVVTLRNSHDAEFQTNMPWNILWTTNEDPVQSAKNLEVVMQSLSNAQMKGDKSITLIDLRFGNKVFYK